MNPVYEAIRSLVSQFGNMSLKDKLLVLGVLLSYTGSNKKELEEIARYAMKAVKIELDIETMISMYMRGEIDEIPIPHDLEEIYIAIMKYFGEMLRKMSGAGW